MVEREEVISTLNDLVEVSKDGEAGFKTAAADVSSIHLKQFFLDRSQEVASGIQELEETIRSFGARPTQTSSLAGALHRRWIDLKSAIASNDDIAVLNEAERGEDVALAVYRNAAKQDLPPNVQAIVQRQLEGVQRNHDRIKQLRDSAYAKSR